MADRPDPTLFINRELSWLAFNARVLHEALDDRVPLLERLKFLAIFSSNLDEFYMVRVAGLRRQVAANVDRPSVDGMSPAEQLAAIERTVHELTALARRCLAELLPALARFGVRLVGLDDLSRVERAAVQRYFESEVFPVLTPLAVDPGHPFPYISNLSISLAVLIRDPETGEEHFARVKVPRSLPRWVPVEGRPNQFVPLEALIGANLEALFPGMEIRGCYAFRITRYSDLELPEGEEPEDLLTSIEEQVFKRRFGEVVRMEVEDAMPQALRSLLIEELRDDELPEGALLSERDIDESGTLLDLGELMALTSIDIPELRYPPFTALVPAPLHDAERSIFDVIRDEDLLVHHPFESFPATVERFLETAAEDEQVLAIKMTLYRTSGDTAIVQALTEAAQRGKQVAVMVELKARGDEANNIQWARKLESYGVHVSYGSQTLKTHAKTVLVVRREPDGIRRYVHIGSGNYNSKTARLYTDVGLLTCRAALGPDVTDLFNSLTGFSRQRAYQNLLVAPIGLRQSIIALIEREAAHARAGRPARIVAKMNALVDPEVIEALYRASSAGVDVDLIVRGICCLRPGIAGISDRIRVVSIIGRFLEHSRIMHFANGGDPEYYLGSADWMQRNFDRRVEAVTPVFTAEAHARLASLLDAYLSDARQAWDLEASGTWRQRNPESIEPGVHDLLTRHPWGIGSASIQAEERV